MRLIEADNVCDAYRRGMQLLATEGVEQNSRAGLVRVVPYPVITSYNIPTQRVLFEPSRDANPFFHLMESLWMLAGRNDARWLDQFVGNFSSRFAETDGIQHGAYGYRWRNHFGTDQLNTVIRMLTENKLDRRVVIQMWDADKDLGAKVNDVPCNISVMPRIVNDQLDITVTCRSNDAIWGAYGANAVHFSVLQEYLAARIGVAVGTYYQISNNFHAYSDIFNKKLEAIFAANIAHSWYDYYNYLSADKCISDTCIVSHAAEFDTDLKLFMEYTNGNADEYEYVNPFFSTYAKPLFDSYKEWKAGERYNAINILNILPKNSDWYVAALAWYQRRLLREGTNQG